MPQDSASQMINIFPIFMGSLFILLALLYKRLLRFTGFKPRSEMFTTPRFQRSALINEKLTRLLFTLLGIAYLIDSAGALVLPGDIVRVVGWATLGLAVLVVLAMIGVTLLHWKA